VARRLQLNNGSLAAPGAAAAPADQQQALPGSGDEHQALQRQADALLVCRTQPSPGKISEAQSSTTRPGGCAPVAAITTRPELHDQTLEQSQQPPPFSSNTLIKRRTCWPWSRTSRRLLDADSADQRASPTAPCCRRMPRRRPAPGACAPRGPAGGRWAAPSPKRLDQLTSRRVISVHRPGSCPGQPCNPQELRALPGEEDLQAAAEPCPPIQPAAATACCGGDGAQ